MDTVEILFGLYIAVSSITVVVSVYFAFQWSKRKDEQIMQLIAHQDQRVHDMLALSMQERRQLEDRLLAMMDAVQNWATLPAIHATREPVNPEDLPTLVVDEEIEGRFSGAPQA